MSAKKFDIYNSKESEEKWYSFWEEKGYFSANPNSKKPHYSLLMPPPNLTGDLHLGHAMQHSILDAIARFKRLKGFDVLLLPGVDHAGIQFEGTLNRILGKEGLSKQSLGREKWLEKAEEFKKACYASAHGTWKVFGISADWKREVYTMEPKVKKAVFHEFKTFFEQGLLYKGAYIVQWCPKCQTAIEDVEMEYEEKIEKLYFVKYSVKDIEYITIATARPETIFADTGIAIYPNHPKFKKFVGLSAKNPLNGNLLPIIEDRRVDKNFGTGALKITPGHDLLDYEIGNDHNLPILHVIDKTGLITKLGEDLAGLKVSDAREKAVERLKKLGFIEKEEDYTHSVPVCERCKAKVEPLISNEWFVKMKPLANKALKRLHKIKFYPESYEKILSDWLKEIHDWCISRSLWWGHRIPVWYCQKCNPSQDLDKEMVISLKFPNMTCESCNGDSWVQDEKIFDTWFSSGLWPMATLGWPNWEEKIYFPWDFELSAGEIKYLWIARMVILSLHFNNEIPFKNMFFHGMIRDLQGRKFSKSLGNGIDPNLLRDSWGTDATRMALYTYTAAGRDGKASRQTMDERCRSFRNFQTKIWNIAKFIIDLAPDKQTKQTNEPIHPEDKWIKEQLERVTKSVTKNIEGFQLHLVIDTLYEFIWHIFADIYIEKSKLRRSEAQVTLEYVLKKCLILLHPFMPYLTEEVYEKLPGDKKESIMLENWDI